MASVNGRDRQGGLKSKKEQEKRKGKCNVGVRGSVPAPRRLRLASSVIRRSSVPSRRATGAFPARLKLRLSAFSAASERGGTGEPVPRRRAPPIPLSVPCLVLRGELGGAIPISRRGACASTRTATGDGGRSLNDGALCIGGCPGGGDTLPLLLRDQGRAGKGRAAARWTTCHFALTRLFLRLGQGMDDI